MRMRYEISIELTGHGVAGEVAEILKTLDDNHDCNAILINAIDTTNPLNPIKAEQWKVDLTNELLIKEILEDKS